jgi:hypothetical protein
MTLLDGTPVTRPNPWPSMTTAGATGTAILFL